MLDYMHWHAKDAIRAVLAISHLANRAPSSKQRAELADALKRMKAQLPFAFADGLEHHSRHPHGHQLVDAKTRGEPSVPLDGLESALSLLRPERSGKGARAFDRFEPQRLHDVPPFACRFRPEPVRTSARALSDCDLGRAAEQNVHERIPPPASGVESSTASLNLGARVRAHQDLRRGARIVVVPGEFARARAVRE